MGRDRQRKKRGKEMSIKDQGQTTVSTERRTFKINAGRRCGLSALVTVREVELGPIVPIHPDVEFRRNTAILLIVLLVVFPTAKPYKSIY